MASLGEEDRRLREALRDAGEENAGLREGFARLQESNDRMAEV